MLGFCNIRVSVVGRTLFYFANQTHAQHYYQRSLLKVESFESLVLETLEAIL